MKAYAAGMSCVTDLFYHVRTQLAMSLYAVIDFTPL